MGASRGRACEGNRRKKDISTLWPLGVLLTLSVGSVRSQELGWVRAEGGPSFDRAASIACVPSDGSFVVTGRIDGTATFGLGEPRETTLRPSGPSSTFVARFAKDGSLLWAKGVVHDGYVVAMDNAVFPDGSSVVTGYFHGTVTFGPGEPAATELSSTRWHSLFLARYKADGSLAWARREASDDLFGTGVDVFDDGSIVIVGQYKGAPTIAPGQENEVTLAYDYEWEAIVARYDGDGTLQWARSAGGLGYKHRGTMVAAGVDGSCVVGGWFHGSMRLGDIQLQSGRQWDLFLARYDANGDVQWARRAPAGDAGFGAIAAFPDGSFAVTDTFTGSITLGPGEAAATTLTSQGGTDAFVARFSSLGRLAWARRIGGSADDRGSGIAAFEDGSCVASGAFSGTSVFGGSVTRTSAGSSDAWSCQFDAAGNLQWVKQAGGPGADEAADTAAFTDGSAVVAGGFTGSASFDDQSLVAQQGSHDVFAVRYKGALIPPSIDVDETIVTACDPDSARAAVTFDVRVTGDPPSDSRLEVRDLTAGRILLSTAARASTYEVGPNDFPMGTSSLEVTLVASDRILDQRRIAVTVQDLTPPILLGCGPKTVECQGPQTLLTKSLLGISATDNCDVAPTIRLNPNSSALGSTSVTATACDASGNEARCEFVVSVVDTTAPVFVVFPPGIEAEVRSGDSALISFDIAATDVAGDVVIACRDSSGRNVDPAGTYFTEGVHEVTCTATDGSGNTAVRSFLVTVSVNAVPQLSVPADINVPTEPGRCYAHVSFEVSLTDDDPETRLVCTADGGEVRSGDAFPVGTTVVTCTARDPLGNVAQASFRIVVVDREPPVLSAPEAARLVTTSDGQPYHLSAGDLGASATDNCDPHPSIVCEPGVVPPGTTTVVVRARDLDGNESTLQVRVEVLRGPFTTRQLRPFSHQVCIGQHVPVQLSVLVGSEAAQGVSLELTRIERLDRKGIVLGEESIGPRSVRVVERAGRGNILHAGTHLLLISTRGWRLASKYRLTLRIAKPGHVDTIATLWLASKP